MRPATPLHALFAALLLSFVSTCAAQTVTGTLLDEGGAIYNVKAYGATGNGNSDDSGAIQNAINAATSAGGGVIYFPSGTYLIDHTIDITSVNLISLIGAGMSSNIKVNVAVGISLSKPASGASDGHTDGISHMRLSCTDESSETAVQMTDMIIAPSLMDLDIVGCNVGFDIVNQSYWTERLVAVNVGDFNNNHLFHLDQSPTDPHNSYGYGTYIGIYTNKSAGQDVFYLTGGAYLYHSSIAVKGNFASNATGASIINVQGAAGEPCPSAAYDTFHIRVEGSGYSVVNTAGNGCTGGASGAALVAGHGTISAFGALANTADKIFPSEKAAYLVGTLTTTASSSDALQAAPVDPGMNCYVEAADSTAAQLLSGTYVSSVHWGNLTVSHPAVAGALFQVWCNG